MLDRFKIDQKIAFFEEKAFKQVFACEFRKRIPYYFTKIKKKWGDHVYVEGEQDQSLYVIKKGEVLMYKKITKNKKTKTFEENLAMNEYP